MSTILRYKMVATRKPHICFGCGRKFYPPAKMIAAACADGESVSSYYLCETCDTITRHMDRGDEFGFSDLREEALLFENKSMG
ncbi:MAG: hypothetical protein RR444_05060 [Oscillospiraceae bacterium]